MADIDVLKDVITGAFTDLELNAEQFKDQMTYFLNQIEPDVTKAIAAGDVRSLTYLKARIEGRLTRTSLGMIKKNKDVFLAAVMAAVRVLIKLAAA